MGRTRTKNPSVFSYVLGQPTSGVGLSRNYNFVNRTDVGLGPVAYWNMLNTPSGSVSTSSTTPLITVNGPTEFYTSIMQGAYEFLLLNVYDKECNLFIKYDMTSGAELNIICVGGGGGGGGNDVINDETFDTAGGGAGGAIVQIYEYVSKAGDMLSMCQGSKGIGGTPKNAGSAGKPSYIKYYAYDPSDYDRHDFVAYCYGGGPGSSSNKGYDRDPYILMCPKDGSIPFVATLNNLTFEAGAGGDGAIYGGSAEPSRSLSAAGGDFKTILGNYNGPLNDPSSGIPMYTSYSGGGGGSSPSGSRVEPNENFSGGGGGGYVDKNNYDDIIYGQGGFQGHFSTTIEDRSYVGLPGSNPGAGGGAGGITNDSSIGYSQYGGGDGGNGLIMLIIKRHPSGNSWFSTSWSTQTASNNFTIIPSNPKDYGKDYAYSVTPNSTRTLNAVLVASGGGAGASSRGESNGGGGGGGFCSTTFTPSSNTDSLQITVGSPAQGGVPKDGQSQGQSGNNTIAELASGGKSVLVYGGQPGNENASGFGGIANSSPYGTGGKGGDRANGGVGAAPAPPLFSEDFDDFLNITSLVTQNYSGGGSGGKGTDDSGNNYPAGIAGFNDGKGGIWNSNDFTQIPGVGLICTGIGGGGGAGGYEADQTEFDGGASTSGICVIYYPINY
jgi:hypothetical protein